MIDVYKLQVTEPCISCAKLWLPHAWQESNVEFVAASNGLNHLVLKDEEGNCLHEPYYPHPFCHLHFDAQPKPRTFDPDKIKKGYFSPIKDFGRLPTPEYHPTISVAVSELPLAFAHWVSVCVGQGVDVAPERADLKAKMEAIERFCTYLPPRGQVFYGRPNEMQPNRVCGVSDQDETERTWLRVKEFTSGRDVLAPVEYFQLAGLTQTRHPVVKMDSTGMALHTDWWGAFRGGLSECLERAGTGAQWQNKIAFTIDSKTLPDMALPYVRAISALGYQAIAFFNEPVSGFFAYTVVIKCNTLASDKPALVCCSGGDWDSEQAVTKALAEAYGQLVHALEIFPSSAGDNQQPSYQNFLHYLKCEHATRLLEQWGLNDAKLKPFIPKTTPATENDIKARYLTILVADRGNILTDALSLYAVQVVVPALTPKRRGVPNEHGLPYPYA